MARPELRLFVERSLAALEREAPEALRRVCGALAGRRVRICGDGPAFALLVDPRSIELSSSDGSEDVQIEIDRSTILALVDATLTLEDALRDGRFDVRATPADAVRAFDALTMYVRGGMRCPAFPGLLSTFRGDSLEETER